MITLYWVPNTVLEAGANDCFNLNALVSGLQSQDLSCPSSPGVTVNAFFSEPCPSSKNYAWETEGQDSDHPKSTLDQWLGKLTTKKGINLCLLTTSVGAPAAWLSHQIQSVNTAQNPWEGGGKEKKTHAHKKFHIYSMCTPKLCPITHRDMRHSSALLLPGGSGGTSPPSTVLHSPSRLLWSGYIPAQIPWMLHSPISGLPAILLLSATPPTPHAWCRESEHSPVAAHIWTHAAP